MVKQSSPPAFAEVIEALPYLDPLYKIRLVQLRPWYIRIVSAEDMYSPTYIFDWYDNQYRRWQLEWTPGVHRPYTVTIKQPPRSAPAYPTTWEHALLLIEENVVPWQSIASVAPTWP